MRDLRPFVMPPPLTWQRPSSPVQSVNEVEGPGGMAGGEAFSV